MSERPTHGRSHLKALLLQGDISVDELVAQVGTSTSSVRRDLARFESVASSVASTAAEPWWNRLLYEPCRHDTSFQALELRFADQKRSLGWPWPS